MTLDHLIPSVRELALLPAEQRIAKIRSDYWIGYSRAEQALNKLEDLLNWPQRIRMPNMLIISPTNNGKTMIVEKFKRNHLPYLSEDGDNEVIPVLMIQMPTSPSVARFYASIISQLGSSISFYTSIAKYENMAIKFLYSVKTKILIIDELHNILSGTVQRQREFLNVLRFLGNTLQLSIVGVGIKDAYLAIQSDNQLENRFEPLILPLWKNDSEFSRLLASFSQILPLNKPSDLLNSDIRSFILEKSEGTIGKISALLTQAACEAIASGQEYIDLNILEQTNYRSSTQRRKLYESMVY